MHKLGFIIILLLLKPTLSIICEALNFSKQEDYATIVIYGKSGRQLTAMDLLFDDIPVISSFTPNTYFEIKHTPGKVSLKTKGKLLRSLIEEREYSLTLEAGKTYYLEAMVEYQVLMTSLHLIRKSTQVGAKETKNMKSEFIDLTIH